MTEENASAMITHLCAALGRIHRGEPVEPLDEEVYEETSQEPTFPKALEATQALVREILPDLPEDEQKFLTMHIGSCWHNRDSICIKPTSERRASL